MTAELLRRAAKLARETAESAPRGPYTLYPDFGYHRMLIADDGDPFGTVRDWSGGIADETGSAEQSGAHIVLWHPGVALAVAGLLEERADLADSYGLADAAACEIALALLNEGAPQ